MDNKSINNEVDQKWLKKHKKELIIGGAVLVGTAGAVITYLLLRKKVLSTAEIVDVAVSRISAEPLKSVSEIPDQLIKCAQPTSPIYIAPFPRRLPEGQHASLDKLKLAESLGITIPNGHTLVRGFTKYNNLSDCA